MSICSLVRLCAWIIEFLKYTPFFLSHYYHWFGHLDSGGQLTLWWFPLSVSTHAMTSCTIGGGSIFLAPLNTLRLRLNGCHFADDTLKCIFFNENVWIPIEISSKFVPKGPIDNIPALVLIMAWRRPGDTPLSEPMLVRSLTHIWITRPQWVNCL